MAGMMISGGLEMKRNKQHYKCYIMVTAVLSNVRLRLVLL